MFRRSCDIFYRQYNASVSNVCVRIGGLPRLRAYLERHPFVSIDPGSAEAALEFETSRSNREIWVGRTDIDIFGLVELIDNNPLVCADSVSLPLGPSNT